jgi:hypothetical protein
MEICTRVEQEFHHRRVLINYSKMQNTFPWNEPYLSATFTLRCTNRYRQISHINISHLWDALLLSWVILLALSVPLGYF